MVETIIFTVLITHYAIHYIQMYMTNLYILIKHKNGFTLGLNNIFKLQIYFVAMYVIQVLLKFNLGIIGIILNIIAIPIAIFPWLLTINNDGAGSLATKFMITSTIIIFLLKGVVKL